MVQLRSFRYPVAFLLTLMLIWALVHTQSKDKMADSSVITNLFVNDQYNNDDCHFLIDEFEPAPEMLAAHLEGAVGKTENGFVIVSGFSHYIDKLLIATSRVEKLDATTLDWSVSPKPSPIVASHFQGASDRHYLWVAGGFVGQHPGRATAQVWRYDTRNDSWQTGPPLPSARASGAMAVVGQQLHYVSGLAKDRRSDLHEHLMLDLKKPLAWSSVANFHRSRNHFQIVVINGVMFAVGGQMNHDDADELEDLPYLDAFHPDLNQWIPLADMPTPRSHAEMATLHYKGRILVLGGRTAEDSDNPIDSIAEYNPATNRWREVGRLPVPLISPFAQIIDNSLYVSGGGLSWNKPQFGAWTAAIESNCPD